MKNVSQCEVLIIGGGAAGLMCAAVAAARGRNTVVLERSKKPGRKILMSGGGRCNFTNMYIEPDNYVSNNPHFCKSALSRYTQWDFIALVSRYGLEYHEKTLGQLFCDHSAKDILAILEQECEAHGASLETECEIHRITPQNDTGFIVESSDRRWQCESLVLATGGLSIPSMGATGFGYDVAKQFGHSLTARVAALVPFTVDETTLALCQSLSGVSLPARVSCESQHFSESILFTHKGLSGPAILQISNYWDPGKAVHIDLLPTLQIADYLHQQRSEKNNSLLGNVLAQHLPKRFVQALLTDATFGPEIENRPVTQLSDDTIGLIEARVHRWSVVPKGTEGWRTAEVTRGGVNVDEVSSKTFESRKQPGLYFIGEVLDVTGWLGGFNFQWAWSSAWCAGQYV